MLHDSWRKLVAAHSSVSIAFIASGAGLAATDSLTPQQVELDPSSHGISGQERDSDKLTAAEQQTLADEITGLLGAARSTQAVLLPEKTGANGVR